MKSPRDTLGVDIGGVVIDIDRALDRTATDPMRRDDFLSIPEVPDAIDSLAHLNAGKFAGRVHLVSKCDQKEEAHIIAWLRGMGFFSRTGIDISHLHFCRDREGKAGICKQYNITHFIDDRREVLASLRGVARYLFNPTAAEHYRHSGPSHDIVTVYSWASLAAMLS